MDPDPFVRWALDDARTVEERFAIELMVEQLEPKWRAKHGRPVAFNWEAKAAKTRERFINPAYLPRYSEKDIRRVAEMLPGVNAWSFVPGFEDRPLRDVGVLRFFPALETLTIGGEISDIGLLAELPKLRAVSLRCPPCTDYRPLARCASLRRLTLTFGVHWPEVAGLETLQQLEWLSLSGNLLVFPPGLIFPRVRQGRLQCTPLSARDVRHLPQYPACEFLYLEGVERLDGIEAMPRLRNLTVAGPVATYAPLAALRELTCFRHQGALPLDVTPLNRVPALLFAAFETKHNYGIDKVPPRDHGPLAESPTLREVTVEGCPPVELEIAALNAALPGWADRVLLPEPRPLSPLRVIVAPLPMHPKSPLLDSDGNELEIPDRGVLAREADWLSRYGSAFIAERVGHGDWGDFSASAHQPGHVAVTVGCYELMTRFPDVIEAIRQLLARLRSNFIGTLYVILKAPKRQQTAAQAEMDERFSDAEEDEYLAQYHRDDQERLERLHRFRLLQQQGQPIDPAEFAASPIPRHQPPEGEDEKDDSEDEEQDGDDGSAGNVALEKESDPPRFYDDDEHPLADNYRLMLTFTSNEVWIPRGYDALALHLLDRAADEEFPADPRQA